MPQSLKVLIVEENSDDAEMLVQELRRAGFEPDWQQVKTESEYIARLQDGLNLILSNHQTPQFSGLRALELLRGAGWDVPLIVISSAMGDELAVTAMKKGASDYLLRSQLARLGESVSQALAASRQRSEKKHTDQQLLLLGTALTTAANAVMITDAKGIILWVNPAFTRQSGYTGREVLGLTPRLLKSGEHPPEFYKNLWTTVLAGRTWRGCFTNRRKDGALYYEDHTITPVLSSEGVITHLVSIMDDVSERVRGDQALRDSERRLRDILENVDLIAVTVDGNGAVKFCNDFFLRLTGWNREEVVGSTWAAKFLPDSDTRSTATAFEISSIGTMPLHCESVIRTRTGELREIAWSHTTLRDAAGTVCGIASLGEDITSRNRDSLKISAQLRELRQWHGLTQRREERVLALKREVNESLLMTGEPVRYSLGLEETKAPFEADMELQEGNSRRVLLSLLEDRMLAETALRTSEERFRQVVESIREVFWLRDVAEQKIVYISPGYQEIWGEPPEKLYANQAHWAESIYIDDRKRVLAAAEEKQMAGTYDETFRIVRPDGSIRWIRSKAFPVLNAAGETYRVVGVAEDITESKRAELQLKLQHAVTLVLAQATSPTDVNSTVLETLCCSLELDVGQFWMIDRAANVLRCIETWHVNDASLSEFVEANRLLTFAIGEGLLGLIWTSGRCEWSDDVSRDPRSSRSTIAGAALLRGWIAFPIIRRGQVLGVIELFGTKLDPPDPKTCETLDALGAQIGIFIERWQLADQFRQAQKMEAIGTLAGGIAHDFNNVLGIISGYTEIVRAEMVDSPTITERLGEVLRASQRATALVRQILAFSRREELERKPLQLRVAVEEALGFLRATIPSTIDFVTKFAADTPLVLADATQVHQIMMNLCTNAAHAMNAGVGRLTVVIENFIVEKELAVSHLGLRSGHYVRLSVSDTGRGMDLATQSRIFEPFFTTKAPGEGTGLGLSVVHGIMESHEGAITVYSHPGEGTTFHLYFPPYVGSEIQTAVETTMAARGHGERILYLDDEQVLATMGKDILEQFGYVVEAFTRPAEALARLREHACEYDLIITDQMMPGLMGTDFTKQLHAIRMDLPVILTTGFTAVLTSERVHALGIRKLLLKPISVNELGLAVSEVLADSK